MKRQIDRKKESTREIEKDSREEKAGTDDEGARESRGWGTFKWLSEEVEQVYKGTVNRFAYQ